MQTQRALSSIVIAGMLVAFVAGCTPTTTVGGPTSAPIATPVPSGSPTPDPIPTFDPSGNAEDNLAYFNKVGHALLDHDEGAQGKTIVNWFVAHGFNKKDMEVTPDKTSIGLAAWNIEFSVRINGTCIIGQAGNVDFRSYAGPLLATGKCLIGQTRVINW